MVAESRFDGGGPGGGLGSKVLIRDKEVRRAVVGGQGKERAGQGKVKRHRGKRQWRETAEAFAGLSFRPGPSPGRCRQWRYLLSSSRVQVLLGILGWLSRFLSLPQEDTWKRDRAKVDARDCTGPLYFPKVLYLEEAGDRELHRARRGPGGCGGQASLSRQCLSLGLLR